jgi:hypothetical protein
MRGNRGVWQGREGRLGGLEASYERDWNRVEPTYSQRSRLDLTGGYLPYIALLRWLESGFNYQPRISHQKTSRRTSEPLLPLQVSLF